MKNKRAFTLLSQRLSLCSQEDRLHIRQLSKKTAQTFPLMLKDELDAPDLWLQVIKSKDYNLAERLLKESGHDTRKTKFTVTWPYADTLEIALGEHGTPQMFEFFFECTRDTSPSRVFNWAAHYNNLQLVKYIMNVYSYENGFCPVVQSDGAHLDILKYLASLGKGIHEWHITGSLKYGNYKEELPWLINEKKVEFDNYNFWATILRGDYPLEKIKFAHETLKIPYNRQYMFRMTHIFDVEVYEYLIKTGCPYSKRDQENRIPEEAFENTLRRSSRKRKRGQSLAQR